MPAWRMNTQEKINAIQTLAANHQDNVNALQNAQVMPGLVPLAIEAMNDAFKHDAELIFRLTTRANLKL
jgi:hypothetical protein